ncbi:hypothetical protein Trydic_g1466 [Trypoxylus dichotomus]
MTGGQKVHRLLPLYTDIKEKSLEEVPDDSSTKMSMDAMKEEEGRNGRVVNEELWIRINDTKSMLSGSKVNDRMLDSTFSFINGR